MFFGGGFPGFGRGGFEQEDSSSGGEVENKEFYEILGVDQKASPEEIKKAYRKKVVKAHPDKGGDVEEFKKLQAAYEVLSNAEKRELYDRYGIEGVRGEGDVDPFEGLFGGLFGGRGRGGGRQEPRKMKPIIKEINVTLEEIYNGKMRKVSYQRQRTCQTCDGKGGKDAKKCTTCKGQGMIEKLVQLGPGFLSSSRSVCHDCKGEGTTFGKDDRCKTCKGEKVKTEEKTLEVPIEQGAPSEHFVSFSGEGNEAPGTMAGDVIVKFNLEPHKRFERKGADLYYKKKISLYEALTGTAFYVEMLDGKKILVASSNGDIIKPNETKEIRGKGMPFYGDNMSHGNLYVVFNVEFPKKNELKNVEELKKILPVPKDLLTNFDKNKAEVLKDFNENGTNPSSSGGKSRMEEEEDEGMPRGQRVQCAQQ